MRRHTSRPDKVGQHHVEQDHVGLLALECQQAIGRIAGTDDAVSRPVRGRRSGASGWSPRRRSREPRAGLPPPNATVSRSSGQSPPRSIRAQAPTAPPPSRTRGAGLRPVVRVRTRRSGRRAADRAGGMHAPAGIDLAPDAPPTFNADRALTLAGEHRRRARSDGGLGDGRPGRPGRGAGLHRRRRNAAVDTFRATARNGERATMRNIVTILRGESERGDRRLRAPRQRAARRRRGQQRARQRGRGRAGSGLRRPAQRPHAGARVGRRRCRRRRRCPAPGGPPAADAEPRGCDRGAGHRAARSDPGRRPRRRARPGARRVRGGRRPGAGGGRRQHHRLAAVPARAGRPRRSPRAPGGQAPFIGRGIPAITIGEDPRASSDTAPDADRLHAHVPGRQRPRPRPRAGAAPGGPSGSYVRAGTACCPAG